MEQLKIIREDFPSIGAAAAISDPSPLIVKETSCSCTPRQAPPPPPTELPFEATEENNEKMKSWLLDRYASSTFNKCTH